MAVDGTALQFCCAVCGLLSHLWYHLFDFLHPTSDIILQPSILEHQWICGMDGDGTKSRKWFCVVMEAGCCQACLSKRPHTAQRNCKAVPSPAIKIRGIYQICVTIFQRTRGRKEKGVEQTAFMRGMVMVEVRNKRFFTLSGVSSLGPGHKPFTLHH